LVPRYLTNCPTWASTAVWLEDDNGKGQFVGAEFVVVVVDVAVAVVEAVVLEGGMEVPPNGE